MTRPLADLASARGAFTAVDEHFHPAPDGIGSWAETAWWVFTVPEEAIAGWIYLLTRPTLGVASLGVWIWDATAAEPRSLLRSKFFAHVPLSRSADMAGLHLLDGLLDLVVVDPLRRYELRHRDGDVELALDLEGLVEPQPLGIGASTGHADQPLWARGTLSLGARRIEIDGPAFRDRTWSDRPETMPGSRSCYTWAVARDLAFQVIAVLDDDDSPAWSGGFVWRDGRVAPLTHFVRHVVERGPDGRPTRIELELVDELDRRVHASGRGANAAALGGFTGHLTWATLMAWDVAGVTVWGEDHDSWTHVAWRTHELGERSEGATTRSKAHL